MTAPGCRRAITGNQPIANSATVAANETDPSSTNNAATFAITPEAMIPTLSELALLALAIALAAFAAAKLR